MFNHLKPCVETIAINKDKVVESVDKDGYRYLGMIVINSNRITEHIWKNLNSRMGNISKFYACLEHNKNTPLKTKLLVFYNCVYAALLYGVETW